MKVQRRSPWLWATIAVLILVPPLLAQYKVPPVSRVAWPTQEVPIVLPEAWQDDEAVNLAIGDLRQLLNSSYGLRMPILRDREVQALPAHAIIVGQRQDRWVANLIENAALDLPDLAAEGYVLRQVRIKGEAVLVVAASDVLGATYGLFALVEQLRLTPEALFSQIDVHSEPAMTLRLISSPTGPAFPSPEQALRWGYNAVMIEPWPNLVLYDRFDARIYDPSAYSSERAWVEANRQRAREQIRRARQLHLKVVSLGDVFSFPEQVLPLYGSAVAAEGETPVVCPEKPKTLQLLDAALDEVLEDFPEIDAIMVRTGENYTLEHLIGNGPAVGNAGCAAMSDTARLSMVMARIENRVVVAHGKMYIHRAWDIGDAGFHANPAVAATVTKDLPPTDQVIISFKHTQTDFWRYNAVNPNLGVGSLRQMVEFQCAREFEGKGAFPDFLGEQFALGGREVQPAGGVAYAYERGVRSIWVWAKGGGWDGPTPQSDLWLEANIYAISKLAWDPYRSPRALALGWSHLRFGRAAAPLVANVLLRSDDAVLLGLYVRSFALRQGGWTPNYLWVRDDLIQSGEYVWPLYQASRESADFRQALAEKQDSLTLIDLMIADFTQALPLIADKNGAEEALNTLRYERSLFLVLERYLNGLFYFYRWEDSNRRDDEAARQSQASLREWQGAWQEYREVVAQLPGVATPYRDAGMEHTVQEALDELNQ